MKTYKVTTNAGYLLVKAFSRKAALKWAAGVGSEVVALASASEIYLTAKWWKIYQTRIQA